MEREREGKDKAKTEVQQMYRVRKEKEEAGDEDSLLGGIGFLAPNAVKRGQSRRHCSLTPSHKTPQQKERQ